MATKTTNAGMTRDEIRAKARELREKREGATVTTETAVSALSSVDTPVLTSTMTPALTSTMTPIETEAKETSTMNTDQTPDQTPDALDEQTAEVEGMMDRIEEHDATIDSMKEERRMVEEKFRAELAAVGERLRAAEDARRTIVAELVRDYGDEVAGNTLTEEGAQELIDEVMAEVRRAAGEDADFLLAKLKIEEFIPTIDGGAELPTSTMDRMKLLIEAECTLKDGGGADTGELVQELRDYVRDRAGKVGVWGPAIVAAVDSALETTCHWSATPARKSAGTKATGTSKAKNPRQYVEGQSTFIHLPGYVDDKGVEAKIYVAADGQRKVTLGGRGIPGYVARIGHPARIRATLELERLATAWAKTAGYIK